MCILYIGNEHCISLDQLKGYFTQEANPESDTYIDLIENCRSGDLSAWLRSQEENNLAAEVDSASKMSSDSVLYSELGYIFTGVRSKSIEGLKFSFEKSFRYEGVKCKIEDNNAIINVGLVPLKYLHEDYELVVSSAWGIRATKINPSCYNFGELSYIEFIFHRRLDKDFNRFSVLVDGNLLEENNINEFDDNNIEKKHIRITNAKCLEVLQDNIVLSLEEKVIACMIISCFCKQKNLRETSINSVDIAGICKLLNEAWKIYIEIPLNIQTMDHLQNFLTQIIQERRRKLIQDAQALKKRTEDWLDDFNHNLTETILKNCDKKSVFQDDTIENLGLDWSELIRNLRDDFNCIIEDRDIEACETYQDLKRKLLFRI